MEINLLDIVKKQFNADLIQKASTFLGEDSSATQKAIGAVLPSVLGGFVNQGTNGTDATKLMDLLKSSNHDGSILDSMGALLGGGSATQGLINSGDGIISQIFGNKLGGVIDWIASYSGIKAGSASGLMSMVAPLVLGAIGKQTAQSDTGVNGLMGLLGGQLEFVKKALPMGLSSVLGFSNIDLSTPSVSSAVQTAKNESDSKVAYVENDKSVISSILPWLLMAAVGIAGLLYFKTCSNRAPEPPQTVAVPEASPVATAPVDTIKKLQLPEGAIEVKTGSFLDQLYTEATDSTLDANKALTFDNVNFATGSAQITEDSKVQLDDLVKIMKGYPKVEIKIEGHTDNKGNEAANKKLSESRSLAVKTYLASHGITATRMATAGFGSTKPIGDNATDEGRAKNRRIEAFIVKK